MAVAEINNRVNDLKEKLRILKERNLSLESQLEASAARYFDLEQKIGFAGPAATSTTMNDNSDKKENAVPVTNNNPEIKIKADRVKRSTETKSRPNRLKSQIRNSQQDEKIDCNQQ